MANYLPKRKDEAVMTDKEKREKIVELRDIHGMSFTEIGEELGKYGVKASKQSVHGIYKRAKSKVRAVSSVEDGIIVAVYARTMNIKQTEREMKRIAESRDDIDSGKCSYNYIRDVVATHNDDVQEETDKIVNCISIDEVERIGIENVAKALSYMGVNVSKSVMTESIERKAVCDINKYIREQLRKVLTGCYADASIARKIVDAIELNRIEDSITEIKREVEHA